MQSPRVRHRRRRGCIKRWIARSKILAVLLILTVWIIYVCALALTVMQTNYGLKGTQRAEEDLDPICNRMENIFLAPFAIKVTSTLSSSEEGAPGDDDPGFDAADIGIDNDFGLSGDWKLCHWRWRNIYFRVALYTFGCCCTFYTLISVICGISLKSLDKFRMVHLCISDMVLFLVIIDAENMYTGWSACHYRFIKNPGGEIEACSPWPFALIIITGFVLCICEGVLFSLIHPYCRYHARQIRNRQVEMAMLAERSEVASVEGN